jgi:hypothetical protein
MNGRSRLRRAFRGIWLLPLLTVPGCAGSFTPPLVELPAVPAPARDSLLRIAVVVRDVFESSVEFHVPTPGEATRVGASQATGEVMSEIGNANDCSTACIGVACLPFAEVFGAASGAARAQKPSDVTALREFLTGAKHRFLDDIADRVPRIASGRVAEELTTRGQPPSSTLADGRRGGSEYAALAAEGFDAVLEIRGTIWVVSDSEIDPKMSFLLSVSPRLIRIPGDRTIFTSARYDCDSPAQPFSVWVADSLSPTRSWYGRSCLELAEKVVDETFLVDPLTRRVPGLVDSTGAGGAPPTAAEPTPMYFGLEPVEPPTDGARLDSRSRELVWAARGGTRPTFRWKPFRGADSTGDSIAARVSAVTYDLRIAESRDGNPGPPEYEFHGLPTPEYQLPGLLRSGAHYFWTVRARYELDGRPRATEWGCVHPLGRRLAGAPNRYSYRFTAR